MGEVLAVKGAWIWVVRDLSKNILNQGAGKGKVVHSGRV